MNRAAHSSAADPAQAEPASPVPLSVLLFAAQPFASRVAESLRQAITPRVVTVETQALCLQALRHEVSDVLVLETSTSLLDPHAAEALYGAAGTAIVVEVNFGLMQPDRILLAVRSALKRRQQEQARARAAAQQELQRDLSAALTGLLLESQLALYQSGPAHAPALARLVDLAEHLRAQFCDTGVTLPDFPVL